MNAERIARLRALLDDEYRDACQLSDVLSEVLDEAVTRVVDMERLRAALVEAEAVDGSDVAALARAFGRLLQAARLLAAGEDGGAR